MFEERDGFWRGVMIGAGSVLVVLALVVVFTFVTGRVDWTQVIRGERLLGVEGDVKLDKMQDIINQYYLDDVDQETLEDSVCKGLMNGLGDKYAAYYNEEEYAELQEKNSGNYCGIGAYVTQNTTSGAITVVQPIQGSPAQKAGLQAGDIIYAVDGEEVEGSDLSTVVAKMKGEKGSKVTLTVIREDESKHLTISMVRDNIETITVTSEMLDNKTGYIAVSAFEEITTKQFRKALDDLEEQGQERLIIDLRDNTGGLLTSCVDMMDRMLPEGKVLYTRDKNNKGEEYYSTDEESFDKPLVILVNGMTASASEVFSGALQDYGRAVLIGERTFGKGIVQSVIGMSDGTALKLTTAKYYTPKGRNIHGTGLEPDKEVILDDTMTSLKESDLQVDNQVAAALAYLKDK